MLASDLNQNTCVNFENFMDILSESEQLAGSFDAGGCTTYRVEHPVHGKLMLIQTPNSHECLVLKF